MAASGFHLPHFSEDRAWLPAWLQPHHALLFDEQARDSQTLSQLARQDAEFDRKNIINGPCESSCSKGDGQFNSFHLFLSGEDSSSSAETLSSGNVLQFHLQLSSLGITQDSSSSLKNILLSESNEPKGCLPIQPVIRTSVIETIPADLLPQIEVPKISHKSALQNCNRSHRKKLKKRFTEAVELSIAASEAMAISQSLKSERLSETLPASAILEVALRVKQARNQYSLDVMEDIYTSEEVDETDQLSELNDESMVDAFEDVGLPFTQVCGTPDDSFGSKTFPRLPTSTCSSDIMQGCSSYTSISRVQNTHLSESQYEYDGEVNKDIKALGVDFKNVACQRQLDDASSVAVGPDVEQEIRGGPPSVSEALCMETHFNSSQYKSVPKSPNTLGTTEIPHIRDGINPKEFNFHIEGRTPLQTQGDVISSPCNRSYKQAEIASYVAADRFRSRWLGGWVRKDVEVKITEIWNNYKTVPNIRETSFLSESVDVIKDENSVHRLEVGSSTQGLHRNIERTILSQDIVGSSNFSMTDPLCSVVPCSISSDNGHVGHVSEAPVQCSTPRQEFLELESLPQKIVFNAPLAPPLILFPDREECGGLTADGEGSGSISRKQLASLRSYSMVGSARNLGSEWDYFCQNGSVSLKDTTKRINDFSSGLPILDPVSKGRGSDEPQKTDISSGVQYEKKTEITSTGKTISELQGNEVKSESCNEERGRPLVLNYGTRRRLRACNIVVSDTDEEYLKEAMPQKKARLGHSKYETNCSAQIEVASLAVRHSCLRSKTQKKDPVAKKRVCFSESQVKFHQSNTCKRQSSGDQTCSRTKNGKRMKRSGLGSKSKIEVEKYNILTSCSLKGGERLIFQGLEFLLTGYSSQKERELEMRIRKHGGVVLDNFPSAFSPFRGERRLKFKYQKLPLVLSPEKVQTTKFLYGCAVQTLMLKTSWLTDSLEVGSVLAPDKYLILSHQAADSKRMRIGHRVHHNNHNCIFDRVGVMLLGKPSFCSTYVKIIKHGGGQVFKALHWLVQSLKSGKKSVGAIVVEDEGSASRHLRQCALEHKLQMMPVSWIIDSLHSGKLLPLKDSPTATPLCRTSRSHVLQNINLSEEI